MATQLEFNRLEQYLKISALEPGLLTLVITDLSPEMLGPSDNTNTLGYILKSDYAQKFTFDLSLNEIPDRPNLTRAFKDVTTLTVAPSMSYGITDLTETFQGCINLQSVPCIPKSIKSLNHTFDGCANLEVIHKWQITDPSEVDMEQCFNGCSSLARIETDPNYFYTPKSVTQSGSITITPGDSNPEVTEYRLYANPAGQLCYNGKVVGGVCSGGHGADTRSSISIQKTITENQTVIGWTEFGLTYDSSLKYVAFATLASDQDKVQNIHAYVSPLGVTIDVWSLNIANASDISSIEWTNTDTFTPTDIIVSVTVEGADNELMVDNSPVKLNSISVPVSLTKNNQEIPWSQLGVVYNENTLVTATLTVDTSYPSYAYVTRTDTGVTVNVKSLQATQRNGITELIWANHPFTAAIPAYIIIYNDNFIETTDAPSVDEEQIKTVLIKNGGYDLIIDSNEKLKWLFETDNIHANKVLIKGQLSYDLNEYPRENAEYILEMFGNGNNIRHIEGMYNFNDSFDAGWTSSNITITNSGSKTFKALFKGPELSNRSQTDGSDHFMSIKNLSVSLDTNTGLEYTVKSCYNTENILIKAQEDGQGFDQCTNLTNCHLYYGGTKKYIADTTPPYAYSNCLNLNSCTAFRSIFYKCYSLNNCLNSDTDYGFYLCKVLQNCAGYSEVIENANFGPIFAQCSDLVLCKAAAVSNTVDVSNISMFSDCVNTMLCSSLALEDLQFIFQKAHIVYITEVNE